MSFEFFPRADSRKHQQLRVLNAPAERMTSFFALELLSYCRRLSRPAGPLDRDARLHGTPLRWLWTVSLFEAAFFSNKTFVTKTFVLTIN